MAIFKLFIKLYFILFGFFNDFQKVNDPELLGKLARSFRPAIIFDINGSILVDMGGMETKMHDNFNRKDRKEDNDKKDKK